LEVVLSSSRDSRPAVI